MSEESGTTTQPGQALRGPVRRFDAVAGGVIWWACHLAASYWLVPRTCAWGTSWPIHAATIVLLALIGRAWLSGRQLVHAGRVAGDDPGAERDVYLGWTGMMLAIFFGAVTVAEWIPTLFYDPCW